MRCSKWSEPYGNIVTRGNVIKVATSERRGDIRHTKSLRLTTLVLFRSHRCELSVTREQCEKHQKVVQREDKEETLKEGASNTHPIRCPCWKTWRKTKQIHLRNWWHDDGIMWTQEHQTSLSTKMHALPHWVDSSRLSHSSRDIQLMACVYNGTISGPGHTCMNSNRPPYDTAISKQGIPTDKTFQISPWDFFWFSTVMSTYKLRTKSHRWIWIERRENIELRLIAHMGPFPILRHQVEKNTIVTIDSNVEWKDDLASPFFRGAFGARQVILQNERRKSSYDGVHETREDARFNLVRHS